MTFLNPLALFGLLAAGIPILLHLLNLRRLRTVEFSTLTFLKELQKTRIRRIKIKQLLLLILRTLLVLLLVVAFSRPTLKGTLPSGLGERAKTTVVILLDDSFSMTASNERGVLLKQAKENVSAILDGLKDGDEVYLLKLSEARPTAESQLPAPSRNFALIRSLVREIKPSPVFRTLPEGLQLAAKLIAQSRNYNREVYIISDFQEGLIQSQSAERPSDTMMPQDTRLFLIHLSSKAPSNFGITDVQFGSTIIEQGRPIRLKATVANFSHEDARDHVVSAVLNGMRVAQKSIDVRAGGSVETEFSIVPDSTGFLQGWVELEDDDLEFDNRRYFSIHVPSQERVLLVGTPRDLRYVTLALSARLDESRTLVAVEQTLPDRLSAAQINAADAIIVANTVSFTAGQIDLIKSFLENGGGLMLFVGSNVSPAAYQASLGTQLQLPAMAAPEVVPVGSTKMVFDKTDFRHPLFAGMFEGSAGAGDEQRRPIGSAKRELESPDVATTARFLPTAKSATLISLSNGAPFLLEQRVGKGTVLLFSVSATNDWSNFPTKGLFVPLLHRGVTYLARQQALQPSILAGEEVVLATSRAASGRITVSTPSKIDVLVNPSPQGGERLVKFSSTDRVGTYFVRAGNGMVATFNVNVDGRESNTQPATESMLQQSLENAGIALKSVTTIRHAPDIQRTVTETRYGAELWRFFLLLALVIAICEMLVARSTKKESIALGMK